MGTAGLVMSIIALIVALSGGAYAASHRHHKKNKGVTTAQVRKIAKQEAQKYANSNPGSKGDKGDPGSAGSNGTNGTDGTNGKDGKDGKAGANGKSATMTEIPLGQFECEERGGAFVNIEEAPAEDAVEICNGKDGLSGQDAGFNYVFNSSTTPGDPGAGELALNAAAGSATVLSISETDGDANGLASVIKAWVTSSGAQGTILIRKAGSPGTFAEYTLSENKDEGSYDHLVIAAVGSNGAFADQDPVTISYWSSGVVSSINTGSVSTLPIGATQVGTWAFSGTEADNGAGGEKEGILVPISFPAFTKNIPREQVFVVGEAGFSTHCSPFTSASPGIKSAEYEVSAGVFEKKTTACIFLDSTGELHNATLQKIWRSDLSSEGFGKAGGVLQFHISGAGLGYGTGTWAVQAH